MEKEVDLSLAAKRAMSHYADELPSKYPNMGLYDRQLLKNGFFDGFLACLETKEKIQQLMESLNGPSD